MRDFRLYMAVGGMPQAVEAYIQKENFEYIDNIKRKILNLYFEDLVKIDPTGRLSNIYKAIPSQLALKKKHFVVSSATGKKQTSKDESRFFELLDSKTVLCCYHVANPDSALAQTKDLDRFKLYASDTGLFISLMFDNSKQTNEIYAKLLSDKLDADLGYLYENVAAQIITASGKELYYHTWSKENSTHRFEIDFLLSKGNKIIPLEIKSSATRNHESIENFVSKYSKKIYKEYLFSQKDVAHVGQLLLKPLYMLPFVLEEF
jgi:predicted AAA+ superfamily ATPase